MKIVLSPHLDDAVLSAYSVLAGGGASVVNVFDGMPHHAETVTIWDRLCGFESSAEAVATRLAEDSEALWRYFKISPMSLGLREDLVRGEEKHDVIPERFRDHVRRRLWDALRMDVVEANVKGGERPTVYAPLGGGPKPNPDHVLVRDATRDLLVTLPVGSFRLVLYADQPYSYKNRKWPSFVEGIEDTRQDHRWWGRFPRAVPEMVSLTERIEVVRLPDPEAKSEVLKAYRSQYKPLNTKLRVKGLLRDPALYGVEVFWSLNGDDEREEK